jgi:hypothetical protein
MDSSAPAINPLGLDPNGLLYFGIASVAASVIVVLYCWPKFDESTEPKNDDDLVTQFLPRDLVSPREYSRGLLIYLASMLLMLGTLSVMGPSVLNLFAIQAPQAFGATPVAVALAIVGLFPNLPLVRDIEMKIRQFAHGRAFIPAAARATADRLTAAKFDFTQYRGEDVLRSDEMSGVRIGDFEAARGSIEYNWARLCSLCYALRMREDDEAQTLDRSLLKSYRRDLDSVYANRASLQAQIDKLRINSDVSRNDLRAKIRDALQKMYVFIGCSTRLSGRSRSAIDGALHSFGFNLEPVRSEPSQGDVMIVGLAVMAGSVLLICYVASELGKLDLWSPSPYFPTRAFDPFVWAISAVLAHGAAILTADRVRGAMLKGEKWYDSSDAAPNPSVANYIRVGVVCLIVGYIVLLACAIALQTPTLAMAKGTAPYAFMPAVTGAFYAIHLDNVELKRRPGRLFEIAPQAILTGFMGLAASEVWISSGSTTSSTGIDFLILVTIMGFAVGASLAWSIPRNAMRRSYDPCREAKENRIRDIVALAGERLGNTDEAQRWLRTETWSLEGKSPIAAVGEASNYEEVLRLISKVPAASLPEREARPAEIRVDLQSDPPARERALGTILGEQHNEMRAGDLNAGAGPAVDGDDMSELRAG